MSFETYMKLSTLLYIFFVFSFPAVAILFPKVCKWPVWSNSTAFRIAFGAVSCWIVMIAYRATIQLWIYLEYMRALGDQRADGVGGNAVILFMGWIPPLLVGIMIIIVRRVAYAITGFSEKNSMLLPRD